MRTSRRQMLGGIVAAACAARTHAGLVAALTVLGAPGEFEHQDYIWLPWVERGFFGAEPLSSVVIQVIRSITPHVRVRLLYSGQQPIHTGGAEPPLLTKAAAEERLRALLAASAVDLDRVELIFHELAYGAIQDPGPYFLRTAQGLAVADYRLNHPDPRAEAMDRTLAAAIGLPSIQSRLVSEGGARQSNGRGILLLSRVVEQVRNPGWSLADIEAEHLRVHGARKIVWLERGPADEEWGKLTDGRWGIGTGGHVDVFARFANPSTILLAEVSRVQRETHAIMAETHERMERNFDLLRAASDQNGQPFTIIRVPVPDPIIASIESDQINVAERSWLPGARAGGTIEYYLPASYLNFIIANGVVVSCRLHGPGLGERFRETDRQAMQVLEQAFPGRRILQIEVTPLLHGGGGLHCHSRNQPKV